VNPDLSEVAVVIPALNEEHSLPLVLRAMPNVGVVLVVDNGSDDRTHEVAESGGAIVLSEPNRGYGNACQAGIAEASKRGFTVVVILDGDHSFDPQEMGRLVGPILADDADMVLGDRTATAEAGALEPQQVFGNRVATHLIHRVSGHRYRDMGPFRAIRTSTLLALNMEDPNYGWNVEMQLKILKYGYRVQEVPVSCRPRAGGTSKISGSLRSSLRCGAKMMAATLRYAR
jgi:hypothetical protein